MWEREEFGRWKGTRIAFNVASCPRTVETIVGQTLRLVWLPPQAFVVASLLLVIWTIMSPALRQDRVPVWIQLAPNMLVWCEISILKVLAFG